MTSKIKLTESLKKTIALEQRALADGGTLVNRNNTVNSIPYTLLKQDPSLVLTPSAYKAGGTIYSVVPNVALGDFTYTQNTANGTIINENGNIEVLPANTPRITWINGKPEILVESTATYLLENSDDLLIGNWSDNTDISNVGSFVGISKWRHLNISPTGIIGTGYESLNSSASYALTAGLEYTFSFIVEFGTSPAIGVLFRADTVSFIDMTVNSDLTFSGLTDAGSYNNLTGRFTEIQNTGVYIVEIKFTAVNTENYQLPIRTGNCMIGNVGAAVAGSTSFFGNFAFRQGGFSTSRCITSGGTATRNDDIIDKSGLASVIGQTEGAIFMDCELSNLVQSDIGWIFDVFENAVTDRISVYQNAGLSSITVLMEENNTIVSINSINITDNRLRIFVVYTATSFKVFINGSQVVNDVVTFGGYTNCNEVTIGNRGGATNVNDGIYIDNFELFKTPVSDQFAINSTTI